MASTAIVGSQWGDEGKGKITDWMAGSADAVVRYAGGNNAGHTVITAGEKYELHLIPSGILHEEKQCFIGSGVVVDPGVLLEEMQKLRQRGVSLDNLYVSRRAHLVLPGHRRLDNLEEESKGEDKIGTTGRGIGPAYSDKAARRGIRVGDMLSRDRLKERLKPLVEHHNMLLSDIYGEDPLDYSRLEEQLLEQGEKLSGRMDNVALSLEKLRRQGKDIVFEGAQGTLLDIDFGTYPFVTSSHPGSGGISSGSGFGPTHIDEVIGVTKAYITRVGRGPMPTELTGSTGEKLRQKGGEFGVTTGRPRRCGWLDLPALRHAVMVNGLTSLALSKIDVLSGFETVKLCTHYSSGDAGDDKVKYLPADLLNGEKFTPVYEEIPGWSEDIKGCRQYDELPDSSQRMVSMVEEAAGIPVSIVSTGPDRDHIIDRRRNR